MATSTRPSQATFWRRRLIAVGILLVVLIVLVSLLSGGGDEQPASRYTPPADSAPALPNDRLSPAEDARADRDDREAAADGAGSAVSPQSVGSGTSAPAPGTGTVGQADGGSQPPPRQGAGPNRETGGVGAGIDPRDTGGTPAQ